MTYKWPAAFIGVLAVIALAWGIIPCIYSPPQSAAEFGDMFGGVNALFSGLAFVGLIWAIVLQKEELGLQRQELAETRKELKGQKEQLELQNTTFKQQAFDSAFFHMLSLHHQIVSDLDINRTGNAADKNGRDVFVYYYKSLKGKVHDNIQLEDDPAQRKIKILESVEKFITERSSDLEHYLANLQTIYELIENQAQSNKGFYLRVVASQLSSSELLLIFYSVLRDSCKDFKEIIERSSVFYKLPDSKLIEPEHKAWYDARAYASSAELEDLKA